MGQQRDPKHIIAMTKFLHFVISVTLFYLAWLFFRYGGIPSAKEAGYRYNYYVLIGYAVLLYFFNRTYNSYLLGFTRIRGLVFSQCLAQGFTVIITYLVTLIAWRHIYNPLPLVVVMIAQGVFNCIWSYKANGLYYRINPPRKTLLIYRNENDKRRFGLLVGKPVGRIFEIVHEFEYKGHSFTAIRDQLEGYEAIFAAGIDSRCRNGIAKYCVEKQIPGFFIPHVGDILMRGAQHIQTFSAPVHYFAYKHINTEYLVMKRAFDIFASLLGIIILWPVMLVTALAIMLYDRGPAIYKQVRLTKDGKHFNILKFRSMRVDAEKDGVARLSTGDKDDRITPIGRIVRKCRLDELPQLFNILKGDMSVVGPRPERPEIAEQYYEDLSDFRLRLQVKAGLTGYAQVYGKYNSDPYEKLEFDLLYINDMSVTTDLRLIFATVGILFASESTEGVEEGSLTAKANTQNMVK